LYPSVQSYAYTVLPIYWYRTILIVRMYGHIYSTSIDQPGKVANPARDQLNRENDIPLSAFVPENLVSRDGFGSPVRRQPAHLHTHAESGACRREFLNSHTPSGQSQVHQVTQLRTDGIHCRESAGTGPLNLKVVQNECCLGRSLWTN